MKHPVVRGHPVHAMLSDAPAALIPAAMVTQLWARIVRTPANDAAAARVRRLALTGAGTAGVAGWWDWLKMPRDHPAWLPATLHGALNSAALLALLAAELTPSRRLRALATATGLVLAGGWIGGDLVFKHGWRVRPAEEYEIVAEHVSAESVEKARREVDSFERRETYLPPS
jgi:uncharacterized membrane protein